MSNLRAQILNARDIQSERVTVPAWDNAVIEVRGMSGAERARLMKGAADEKGNLDLEKLYPALLIATCYDPATQSRVFEEADRDALAGKSVSALERVAKVALRLSGLDEEATAKNGSGASAGSTSASPATSAE
jgi:hypothetical protein